MYRILGKSDEQTTCDACGKQNLKAVVILQKLDSTDVVRFGVDCAAKALRGNAKAGTKEVILNQATMIQNAQRRLAAGLDIKAVQEKIWNVYGYGCEIRNDKIVIEVERTKDQSVRVLISAESIEYQSINI